MQSDQTHYYDYDHADKMARGFAFTIDRLGQWYCHDPAMGQGPIRREQIAKLFAGAGSGYMAGKGLKIDDGKYWLTSPEDKYQVEVEDVPFLITDYEWQGHKLILKTNFDEVVALDVGRTFSEPPNRLFPDVPYIEVRAGLYARLARSVFYNLLNEAQAKDMLLVIESCGVQHKLGQL